MEIHAMSSSKYKKPKKCDTCTLWTEHNTRIQEFGCEMCYILSVIYRAERMLAKYNHGDMFDPADMIDMAIKDLELGALPQLKALKKHYVAEQYGIIRECKKRLKAQ